MPAHERQIDGPINAFDFDPALGAPGAAAAQVERVSHRMVASPDSACVLVLDDTFTNLGSDDPRNCLPLRQFEPGVLKKSVCQAQCRHPAGG